MNRKTTITALSALTLAATAGMLLAGPLNPPAGPVQSTMKTLVEVEPRIAISETNTPGDNDSIFRITQPGSYYLTRNITGVAGKNGIEIAASNVTIDLMGYSLIGVAGSFDGIVATQFGSGITILNGVVSEWSQDGIDLLTGTSSRATIRNVVSRNNGAGGTGHGIRANDFAIIEGCTAAGNAGTGFDVYDGCRFIDCIAESNTLNGFDSASYNSFTNCTAFNNSGAGFRADPYTSVSNCIARFNGGTGISLSSDSMATQCIVTGNGSGIHVLGRSLVTRNSCSQNSRLASGAGIEAGNSDNRIEENNCSGNPVGIRVTSAGNLIIRNSCSGNTNSNWSIVANNVYGPIIDRSAPASAAVNGNAAASTLGSTDPNANFTY